MRVTPEEAARFWERVSIGEPDECWLFQARGRVIYPTFKVGPKCQRVHRVAWAIANGGHLPDNPRGTPVSKMNVVMHTCDTPRCCNPKHLDLGDAYENMRHYHFKTRGDPADVRRAFSKLTAESVREIRRVAVTWDGICDMMKKHRASQNTIERIVRREAWKHID